MVSGYSLEELCGQLIITIPLISHVTKSGRDCYHGDQVFSLPSTLLGKDKYGI